jgi:PKD repeat protein/predicted Zn-dependent protease
MKMKTFILSGGILLPKSIQKCKSFLFSTSILFYLNIAVFGQANFCGQAEVMNDWFKKHPVDKEKFDRLQMEIAKTDASSTERLLNTASVTDTIPVVFHVLHLGGVDNISNAQIMDQVSILNRDYQKLNADTSDIVAAFQNNIANVGFAFKLATIDPNGNCTNGITRHYTTKTDWHANDFAEFIYSWPREKYLNIYVVRTMDIAATAYAYLPGTGVPNAADVIVCMNSMVGSTGTGTVANSRVLTHEVAHWFGLQHTWGSSNQPGVACGDDLVSDTPLTKGFISCNTLNADVCTPGVDENVQNYMDYSPCKIMFTNGQATRIINTKNSFVNNRNQVTTHANLIATGVVDPLVCAPDAQFQVVLNRRNICAGTSIQFKDSTENTQVTSWAWSFPGGTPSVSTDSMPTVLYASPGLYSVTYTATNSAGNSSITKTDWINVSSSTASIQAPYTESFEAIIFPNSDWPIDNASGGPGWMQVFAIVGASGANAVMLDNTINDSAKVDVFYTPSYNLSSIVASNPGANFTFKLAHQRASANSNEKLQVFSSTNCGQSWALRYSKTGNALATVAGISTSTFIPTNVSDWRTETVSISAISSQTNVWFKFVFTSDVNANDNNIYIDNINISNTSVGISELEQNAESFSIYPNPASDYLTVVSKQSNASLAIYDALGKLLLSQKLTEENTWISTSSLCKGVYVFKISSSEGTAFKKVIIE